MPNKNDFDYSIENEEIFTLMASRCLEGFLKLLLTNNPRPFRRLAIIMRSLMTNETRLTLDMDSDEHAYLKMACAKLGVTMRQFMLLATFEKMEKIEVDWLAEKAHQTLKRIESGEEKISSWKRSNIT